MIRIGSGEKQTNILIFKLKTSTNGEPIEFSSTLCD